MGHASRFTLVLSFSICAVMSSCGRVAPSFSSNYGRVIQKNPTNDTYTAQQTLRTPVTTRNAYTTPNYGTSARKRVY